MSDLNLFFEERKTELKKSNDFIIYIRKLIDEAIEKPEQTSPILIEQFKEQLPVFKSQTILMLYNLIEGTINKAISSIFDKVNDSNLNHTDLSTHLQKIWLKHLTLNVDDNGQHEDRIAIANQFVNDPVDIQLNEFRKNNKSYFGAGSLDSQKITNIFKKFSITLGFDEYRLKEIKDERNYLAHGEKSFTEACRDRSEDELIIYSQKVITYLELFIAEITKYINTNLYKNQ